MDNRIKDYMDMEDRQPEEYGSPDNTLKQVDRDNNGRFLKGTTSPNPGGRPASSRVFREACSKYTLEGLEKK